MRAIATTPAFALAILLGAGLPAAGLLGAKSAMAVPGGDLSVLIKGHYVCETPGDPENPDLFGGDRRPDSDFTVVGDSSYRARGVRGVYLLTGDSLRFTEGPLKGVHFHRAGSNFVRSVNADGTDGDLRCVNSVQTIAPQPSDTSRCKSLANAPGKEALRARDSALTC
jgi:hypothetical protein